MPRRADADDPDAPVEAPHEAVLGAPGRSDLERHQEPPADPQRRHRLGVGMVAAALMVLSVFFTTAIHGHHDGTHSGILRTQYGVREAIVALVGLTSLWFVFQPFRPDPRVARSAMLAAAMVGVAVGLTFFLGAVQVPPDGRIAEGWPGPQSWMLLLSGVLFIYLRWRSDLWPESPWMRMLMERSARGTGPRRR